MAIVINEIEINVQVISNPTAHPSTDIGPPASKEAVVRECVEKVMEIINLKNER